MNVPCHGCGDRQIGCHGSCEKYKKFVEDLHEKKNIAFLKRADECKIEKLHYDGAKQARRERHLYWQNVHLGKVDRK